MCCHALCVQVFNFPSPDISLILTFRYDRNANSVRDSGISSAGYGDDVEWGVGLGAVKISLVECDVETNR